MWRGAQGVRSMAARLTGPVSGGSEGKPFASPDIDFPSLGYREDEYFLQGTATSYRARPGTELGPDGRWVAETNDTAPFKTRFVVYRPEDPKDFNGTVQISWNNVTGGFDQHGLGADMLESGLAFVGVTVQRTGVHGRDPLPMGLEAWDPERYGSLSIASDDYSYDIFTQVARALAVDRQKTPIDPLGGLSVRHLVGVGGSQSAGWLATYINAIQPLEGVFDAFMPTIYFGAGAPLEVGQAFFSTIPPAFIEDTMPADLRELDRVDAIPTVIRDDTEALVMIVNSETESMTCYPVRQPDTKHFRYWEAAGTSHISAQTLRSRIESMADDSANALMVDLTGFNEVPLEPVVAAAGEQFQRWLDEGAPPSIQPRIAFEGNPPVVARDDDGIAIGGIRLPQVDVPLATNSALPGNNPMGLLGGSCEPFSPEKIRARYGNLENYLSEFERAARAAEKTGVILPSAVETLIAEARQTFERLAGPS
jgi:Alpha/beta hydrolase domain